ncbi:MAG: hypothetical protein ACTSRN_04970, partial [Alphaproteobacteria bacterium]
MIHLLKAVCLFLAATGFANAETVAVTSGEHDGYTRIVLSILHADGWTLQTKEQVTELSFPERALEFDNSSIFSRISRDRLKDVDSRQSEHGTVYRLFVSCPCEVKAFDYLGKYIVIDIISPTGEVEPELQQVEVHNSPSLELPSAIEFGPMFMTAINWNTPKAPSYISGLQTVGFPKDLVSEQTTDLIMSSPQDQPPKVPYMTDQEHEVTSTASAEDYTDAKTAELGENITAVRTSLLEQLTMAADQGLLDFAQQEHTVQELMETPSKEEVESIVTITPEE